MVAPLHGLLAGNPIPLDRIRSPTRRPLTPPLQIGRGVLPGAAVAAVIVAVPLVPARLEIAGRIVPGAVATIFVAVPLVPRSMVLLFAVVAPVLVIPVAITVAVVVILAGISVPFAVVSGFPAGSILVHEVRFFVGGAPFPSEGFEGPEENAAKPSTYK